MKNYYQILNVRQNATDEEIKRSYRVLAKRYHPDVNPGDSAAADKFADINEANEVLSDAKARAEYDAKLAESTTPRINPADVIARQRQQAQAAARQAARQAAYRANMNNNMGGSSASAHRARQAAQAEAIRQAAQAQAMRNAAHAQAQAQAQAQFRDAQVQAQLQAIRNQAYQSGREHGMAEAQAAADAEISRLTDNVKTLTEENKRLQKQLDAETDLKVQLAAAERDRRELEQELFNRDREMTQEKLRAKEIEARLQELLSEKNLSATAVQSAEVECEKLHEMLDKAQLVIKKLEQDKKQLEQDKSQAELRNKAQIQLQQDKRHMMQEEIDELNRQVSELTREVDELRVENEQWQQYAKSEEFLTDAERRLEDWNKKTQADRRLAKPTLYGVLGVLIWATAEEIDDAYAKLRKRYTGKTDESIVAKLAKVEEAYETLSDTVKRTKYNASIDISPERVATERRLIAENESLMEEYRSRLAGKEFWAHFDETQASALSGDPTAQNTLGEMYYYGDEIERDIEQAVFWFKEGAKQKHADSMYNLGICFLNGEGVERNEESGEGFIRQAAKLGSKLAKQYMNAKTAGSKSSGGKSTGKTVERKSTGKTVEKTVEPAADAEE